MTDPMLDALAAAGPHPDHAEKLMLFGQFAGSWELDCIDHDPDGGSTTRRGEWHFGWALGGRAVADVWILPTRAAQEAGEEPVEHGMSVRFYDPAMDAWQSTWTGPVKGRVHTFVSRPVGDEIVLEGENADGAELRWSFSSITPEGFHWRNEVREPGGDWRLQQEMHVRRVR